MKMNIFEIFMVLVLLIIFLVILFACKPLRYFSCFRSSRFFATSKLGDLQRPLISDDEILIKDQTNEIFNDLERAHYQNEGIFHLHSSRSVGRGYKYRHSSSSPDITQGESFVLQVISEPSDNALVSQTLKPPAEKGTLAEVQSYDWQDNRSQNLQHDLENGRNTDISPRLIKDQRSWLLLEVIAGPAIGLQHAVNSTSTSMLPVKLGRIYPADLVLKDLSVSGKHAQITWNSSELKWELVDMGSLNGTLVNSRSVGHRDSRSRKWGSPVELASEDIITLGTTTMVYVRISSQNDFQLPFKIGVTSDPMALRQGGRELPMQDFFDYKWPLAVADKFGLFCLCDGHCGAEAAKTAIKIIPEVLAKILSDSLRREKVLSEGIASDVLKDVFAKTEASLEDYQYEGCTATVLLVWKDREGNFIAQCANLGDSACVIHFDGRYIEMTEDHRVTSLIEKKRFEEAGLPLSDGETRLFYNSINLGRMLGDKFLKEKDIRFIAEPYISEPLLIDKSRKDAFVILASDGLWDVVSSKKAVELVLEMREKEGGTENIEEKIANGLMEKARAMRTHDNTTIVYLDFDTSLEY